MCGSNVAKIRDLIRKLTGKKPKEMLYSPKRVLDLISKTHAQKPAGYHFAQSAVDVLIHLSPDQIRKITDMCKEQNYSWTGDYGLRLDDQGIARAAVPEGGPA